MLFDTTPSANTKFDKVQFLSFEPGFHHIRMLGESKTIFIHYLPASRTTVECLGKECPICENNRRIQYEHPEDYRNMPGYIGSQRRHYMNVLDLTPVKICPSCGHENKKVSGVSFSPACTKCNAFITNVPETVSNKVKIANFSNTLATQIEDFAKVQLDKDKNIIDPHSYNWIINVPGGNKKTPVPMPDVTHNDPIPDISDLMYDLNRAVIHLEPNEISSLLSGVSLRDIFAARKSKESTEVPATTAAVEELQNQINNLFNA